jgi:thioredoxin 1
MSPTVWIIIGSVIVVGIGLFAYGYKKSQHVPNVKPSKKIRNLNKKNFKSVTSKGTILVDFWAPWCKPCKMVTPVLNTIAENKGDKIKVAKVNVDNNKQIATKHKVRNIPTLIIFKDGKEQKRLTGVKTKKAIMKEVEAVI